MRPAYLLATLVVLACGGAHATTYVETVLAPPMVSFIPPETTIGVGGASLPDLILVPGDSLTVHVGFGGTVVIPNYVSDLSYISVIDLRPDYHSPDGLVHFYYSWHPLNFNGVGKGFDFVVDVTSVNGAAASFDVNRFSYRLSSVIPEPAAWAFAVAGVCGVGAALRGRRRQGLNAP